MRDRIAVVAKATFLEAVRDRVLLVSAAFALGLMLFSRVLGWLSLEDTLKMVQDFSLSGLQVLGLLLAMLIGAQSLAREVERRTIYTVLSRDCTRTEFVIGKYVGLVAVAWAVLLVCGAFQCIWVVIWGGSIGGAIAAAILGVLCETLALMSVALLLGALANPSIASVGTLCFYFAGHATEALRDLTQGDRGQDMKGVFQIIYRIVPNLENVNFINHTTSGRPVDWTHLGFGAATMVVWAVVFLAGAAALFRRRQF
ncbi:MAG: ABC transporter permease [Planctomycetes bacterium]|nr:ABC transporter permease [Planctomycetota bacterium]